MLAKNTARPSPRADDSEYSYVVHMLGTAIPTAPDEPRDIVAELHAVVEEVTGSKVDKPARPRMGFLP